MIDTLDPFGVLEVEAKNFKSSTIFIFYSFVYTSRDCYGLMGSLW